MDPGAAEQCPRVTWAGGGAASSTRGGACYTVTWVRKSIGSGIRHTCAETLTHPFLGDPGHMRNAEIVMGRVSQTQHVADASKHQDSGQVLTMNAAFWHS